MHCENLLFLTLILSFALGISTHRGKCVHDEQTFETNFLDVDEEPLQTNERILASGSAYPNIRIYTDFSTFVSGSAAFRSYVQYDLVPPVVKYFESALKVKQAVSGAIKLPVYLTALCGVATPLILLRNGVVADHYLFFTAQSDTSNWVASSTYCYLATDSKRPLISKVKFNTLHTTAAGNNVILHEQNTYLLMHELMHSFGFSFTLFPYFLDSNGTPRKNIITYVNVLGSTKTVLNIPDLTARLRQHYGCASLQGAFLEDNGDTGTANSHFERRHFFYEVMTSGDMIAQKVSEFSLRVLEGSGWYVVDYSFAEPFYFGQGQGCGFLYNTCSASFNFEEMCKTKRTVGCTVEGRGGGVCQTDSNLNGCQLYYPTESLDCQSTIAANTARLPALQSFGRTAGSKCFSGSLSKTSYTSDTNFCFKYSCQGSGTSTVLGVQIGASMYYCTKQGQQLTVSGYHGEIDCPDPLSFCQTVGKPYCPRNCMGNGKCVDNKCVCWKGFQGVDCAIRI